MKKVFFFAVCLLTIIGCSRREEKPTSGHHSDYIDKLFIMSNEPGITNNTRLRLNEKIEKLTSERENDSLTRDYLFQLAGNYFNIKEYEKSLKVSREIQNKSNEAKDLLGLTRSNYSIANYHYLKYNTDSAYYYYSKAEKTSLKLKDQPYYGYILFSKANLLSLKKDFYHSEALTIKALKLALKKENYLLVYDCYLLLGNALLGTKNYEKALEYYQKALETTIHLKSDFQYLSLKTQAYNYLGKVYQKKGDHLKAIEHFNQVVNTRDFRKTNPTLYCFMVNNLAYSKLKLGDTTSIGQFKETLTIADSIKNIPIQITSKIYLSEYFNFRKDITNAVFYAKQAQRIAHENEIFEDELTCLQTLAKIDRRNTAFYTERFLNLTDSLQNIERAARDKYARIEFETDQIIKEKNYIISERDYLATQRWMITIFGLLLISVLTLLYFNNVQNLKNKELQFIQEQQKQNEEIYQLMLDQHQKLEEGKLLEKKRISQDLHDGVMGRLSGIRLNLFALSKRTDTDTIVKCLDQIPRLQEIEREIRSISHNLSSDLFSGNINFIQLIKKLFSDLENHSQLITQLEIDETIEWENISTHIKINIYRILQEALQNIAKYSNAKNITLCMLKSENGINVSISDDGIGFDTQKSKNGIGLKNMRSRVADLKGQFEIKSVLDLGTKINFSIPI